MRFIDYVMRGGAMLDAFCGIGGATRGYQQAGWDDITGVDNDPRHKGNYPSGLLFAQSDAIEYIRAHGMGFRFIHASYPCHRNSTLTLGTNKANGKNYPDLYQATKDALNSTGRPWIMENVGGEIRRDVVLCGEMFGLGVIRHRVFELGGGLTIKAPEHVPHRGRVRGRNHGEWQEGPYLPVYGSGGGKGTTEEWRRAMGINWTDDRAGIAQAIPPAYTWWLTMNAEYNDPRRRPHSVAYEQSEYAYV
jgi:site-specific DNA-cytosine methylase